MGSQTSQMQKYRKQDFITNLSTTYQYLGKVNDSRYGTGNVYKHTLTSALIIEKEVNLNGIQQQMFLSKNIEQQNIVALIAAESPINPALEACKLDSKMVFYMEYFMTSLEDEYQQRVLDGNKFRESEAWFLLYSIVCAGEFLQKQNLYLGDIRPSTILLSDTGAVKIYPFFLSDNLDAFQKATQLGTQTYLSPEQLSDIYKYQNNIDFMNQVKADVYSTIVTIFQGLAKFSDPLDFYDYQGRTVNNSWVEEKINALYGEYSYGLIKLIHQILIQSLEYRPDFKLLKSWLDPYKTQILSQKPFQLENFTQCEKSNQQQSTQQCVKQSTCLKEQIHQQCAVNSQPLNNLPAQIHCQTTVQNYCTRQKGNLQNVTQNQLPQPYAHNYNTMSIQNHQAQNSRYNMNENIYTDGGVKRSYSNISQMYKNSVPNGPIYQKPLGNYNTSIQNSYY